MNKALYAALLAGCLFALPAWAQASDTTTSTTTPMTGSFASLSNDNKKIAEALFDSQRLRDGSGDAWSLDRIAAAKQSMSWGQVFKEMRAEGLIDAKNLKQVVSGHNRTPKRDARITLVVITTGSGERVVSTTRGHGKIN